MKASSALGLSRLRSNNGTLLLGSKSPADIDTGRVMVIRAVHDVYLFTNADSLPMASQVVELYLGVGHIEYHSAVRCFCFPDSHG